MITDPEKQLTQITVLKVFKPEEVLGSNPPLTAHFGNKPCSIFTTGEEFLLQGAWPSKPEGFCEAAWGAMKPYVQTIHAGGNFPHWIKEPGTAVISCPDGFRPVVFKIERISHEDAD